MRQLLRFLQNPPHLVGRVWSLATEGSQPSQEQHVIFESALDAMVIAGDDGQCLEGNAAALELLGVTRSQLAASALGDFFPSDERGAHARSWAALLETGRLEGHFRVRRHDGKPRVVEVRATARVAPGRHLWVMRDLTEHKRLEEQLAASDRMVSMGALAAGVAHEINNPLTSLLANLDFVIDELSDGGQERRPKADPERHVVAIYDSEASLARVVCDFLVQGFAKGEPALIIAAKEHRGALVAELQRRLGDLAPLYQSGKLTVLEAETLLQTVALDPKLDQALFNQKVGGQLLRIRLGTGASRVRVYGEVVDMLFAAGNAALAAKLEEHWNGLAPLEPHVLLCAYRASAFRGPGEVRQVCASHTRAFVAETGDGSGPAWEFLRELVQRIAEEKSAATSGPPPRRVLEELAKQLGDARTAGDRIRHIVRDLKLFAKPDEERRAPIDLRQVLESTLRLARHEVRHRALLVEEYADDVPKVLGNDARLGQVFLNLVLNAAQAIREGDAAHNTIRVTTRSAGGMGAVVEVSDTGSGMPPNVLEHLFEPFFTTKPVGIGTGLGLSICRRIVQQHGGSIEVESTVGQGTTFRVLLPATQAVAEVRGASSTSRAAAARRGRVLVVDDEPAITAVVKRALSSHHDVTAVNSAAEAMAVLDAGEQFDVILCDMMMPQMTGIDFYEVLMTSRPDSAARVVFLTGGVFTPSAQAFLERVEVQHIYKPFEGAALVRLVDSRIAALAS